MNSLPPEILDIILDFHKHHYGTLFSLALTCRDLAEPALSRLYDIFFKDNFRDKPDNPKEYVEPPEKTLLRWKTVLHSSLVSRSTGRCRTYLPYYRYVQYLDLIELSHCLHSTDQTLIQELTAGSLKCILPPEANAYGYKTPNQRLCTALGRIFFNAPRTIRELSVPLITDHIFLLKWIPRMRGLHALYVESGLAIVGEVNSFIKRFCPDLQKIAVKYFPNYHIFDEEDPGYWAFRFLNGLRPNTLKHLDMGDGLPLGPSAFHAISHHFDTLTVLKINNIGEPMASELCTTHPPQKLETLEIGEDVETPLPFPCAVGEWICESRRLRHLQLRGQMVDAHVIRHVLTSPNLTLETFGVASDGDKVDLDGFSPYESLYEHLPTQKGLKELKIEVDEHYRGENLELLFDSLRKLHSLRALDIVKATSSGRSRQIANLASSLPQLERLKVCGGDLDNSFWRSLKVPKLRHLSIQCQEIWAGPNRNNFRFTRQGVLRFIRRLGPQNEGFLLEIDHPFSGVHAISSEEDHRRIREELSAHLKGTFLLVER
ncbi:hypothetical protein FE257_002467 [Aspergillus nanangensis]|uniref:Uncharacterized protein n=1 Tax=Aspergillus nanangensis TaxID=2582783 RepID=A0AAD4GWP8_ASPNN|nr:hypothetical protein FE257_002467 [Aspergillus nanangensis]